MGHGKILKSGIRFKVEQTFKRIYSLECTCMMHEWRGDRNTDKVSQGDWATDRQKHKYTAPADRSTDKSIPS